MEFSPRLLWNNSTLNTLLWCLRAVRIGGTIAPCICSHFVTESRRELRVNIRTRPLSMHHNVSRRCLKIEEPQQSPVRIHHAEQTCIDAVASNQGVSAALGRRNSSIKIKKNCDIGRHSGGKTSDHVAVSPDNLTRCTAPRVADDAFLVMPAPAETR